jgi:hypothetical protein
MSVTYSFTADYTAFQQEHKQLFQHQKTALPGNKVSILLVLIYLRLRKLLYLL